MPSTTTRHLVKRYRSGEGAPSLSLSYQAHGAVDALQAHFRRYPEGVADGTRYQVHSTIDGYPSIWTFEADEARRVLRAMHADAAHGRMLRSAYGPRATDASGQ